MLATSPSASPKNFNYSASPNNGSRPHSRSASCRSSPRFTIPPSPSLHKLNSARQPPAVVSSPTSRANTHVDISTKSSSMTDVIQASPSAVQRKENAFIPGGSMEGDAANALTSALAKTVSNGSDPPAYTQSATEISPTTKRRQYADTEEPPETRKLERTTSTNAKRSRASKPSAKILPAKYENCEVEDMVILIADMISELIETNDVLPLQDVVLTRFHSRTPPGISVLDYLQRLAKHATLGPALLLSMVYYIDRLCSLYPSFSITTLTVHRFLITAATVAAKGLSDAFWNNTTYARVGGIKLAELGMLELEFLYRVDWRIVPNPEVLVDYYRGLVARTESYIIEGDVVKGKHDTVSGSPEVTRLMDQTNLATAERIS